jgi:hypothetical protein
VVKTPGDESANGTSDFVLDTSFANSGTKIYWYDSNTLTSQPVIANSAQHTISEARSMIQDLIDENGKLYKEASMWKSWFYFTHGLIILTLIIIILLR